MDHGNDNIICLGMIMPIFPKEAMAGLNGMDRTPPNGDPSRVEVSVRCTGAPVLIGLQFGYIDDGEPPDPFLELTGEALHWAFLE